MEILRGVALSVILVFISSASRAAENGPSTARDDKSPAERNGGVVVIGSDRIWKLRDDDRIAKRTGLASRVRAEQSLQSHNSYRDVVSGRLDPDAFMPYELFDQLLWGVSDNSLLNASAHKVLDKKVRDAGYEVESFWRTVQDNSTRYRSLKDIAKRDRISLAKIELANGTTVTVPIDRDSCAERINALSRTRSALGGERFDQFLYSAVAREVNRSSAATGTAADLGEQLRYMSGGCK